MFLQNKTVSGNISVLSTRWGYLWNCYASGAAKQRVKNSLSEGMQSSRTRSQTCVIASLVITQGINCGMKSPKSGLSSLGQMRDGARKTQIKWQSTRLGLMKKDRTNNEPEIKLGTSFVTAYGSVNRVVFVGLLSKWKRIMTRTRRSIGRLFGGCVITTIG